MRKAILLFFIFSTPILYFCCESTVDLEESQVNVNKENIIGVAKQLVADANGELSLPTSPNREPATRGVSYSTSVVPIWEKASIAKVDDAEILLVPLKNEEEIRSRTMIQKGNDESYIFSKTFSKLVVRVDKSTKFARIVTYLPDSEYEETHMEQLKKLEYYPEHVDFHGIVLVSSLDGTLIHGLLYENGKMVSKLTSSKHEHSEECAHQHHEKVKLSIKMYNKSNTLTRSYTDGEESAPCVFCGESVDKCTCDGIVIEGEYVYCDKCGLLKGQCICGDKSTVCKLCGNSPCTCGGDEEENEEGGGGNDNGNNTTSTTPLLSSICLDTSNLTAEQIALLEDALKDMIENPYLQILLNKLSGNVSITFVIDSSIKASATYDPETTTITIVRTESIVDSTIREEIAHVGQQYLYYGLSGMTSKSNINVEVEAKMFWDIARSLNDKIFYYQESSLYLSCADDYKNVFRDVLESFINEILRDGCFTKDHLDKYHEVAGSWVPKSYDGEYDGTYDNSSTPQLLLDILKK